MSKTASATTTQVLFFTNTATASTTATATSTSTTVTVATATDQATETATTLTGTITTTSWIPPTTAPAPPAGRRRGLRPIGCPELNTALFLAQGPAQASSLCTFLGVKPRTTTITSTKTSTTATVTTTTATTRTDVTVETALSLTTTTSVTTTTTTADVAVATQTLVDYCTGAATYNPAIGGDPAGTTSQVTTATDAIDCCRKCWLGVNCIGSIFSGANWIQLIITAALDGTPATPMCPLGADDDYIFTPGPGPIYLGPCVAQSQ